MIAKVHFYVLKVITVLSILVRTLQCLVMWLKIFYILGENFSNCFSNSYFCRVISMSFQCNSIGRPGQFRSLKRENDLFREYFSFHRCLASMCSRFTLFISCIHIKGIEFLKREYQRMA